MGRKPCCEKIGLKRGPWTIEEDHKLVNFILRNGIHCWRIVPKLAGLLRCGKSCRLRWINYLRPDLKRGSFTQEEEDQIIELHSRLGNRWSKIATYFPGRTDNEIKNHWNTKIKKKMKFLGIDPVTHKPTNMERTNDDNQNKEPNKDSITSVNVKGDHHNNINQTRISSDDHNNGTGIMKPSNKSSSDDHWLLENYEKLYAGLDLESLLSPQETQISSSLIGKDSISGDELNLSKVLMNGSSYLQEDWISLEQWDVDMVDPLVPWEIFRNFQGNNLFHFGE